MQDWSSTSAIARCLALLFGRHSEQSYNTHLRKASTYSFKAKAYRDELGRIGQLQLRNKLCDGRPEVLRLMEGKPSQLQRQQQSSRNQLIPPQRSNRQPSVPIDTNAVGANIESIDNGPEEQSNNSLGQVEVFRMLQDACTSTNDASKVEVAIGTSVELQQVAAATIPKHSFTTADRYMLVAQLAQWLRANYEENSSSQDSVIGCIKSSQEVPRPPAELFHSIAIQVSQTIDTQGQ